jgi:hypothetical protein
MSTSILLENQNIDDLEYSGVLCFDRKLFEKNHETILNFIKLRSSSFEIQEIVQLPDCVFIVVESYGAPNKKNGFFEILKTYMDYDEPNHEDPELMLMRYFGLRLSDTLFLTLAKSDSLLDFGVEFSTYEVLEDPGYVYMIFYTFWGFFECQDYVINACKRIDRESENTISS